MQEEQIELSNQVVAAIESARSDIDQLNPCQNKREKKWGRTLVERKRRHQNDGLTVMQKAMSLNQEKNLEVQPVKGNYFAALDNDYLNQISKDVNIYFGNNSLEHEKIVDDIRQQEIENFNSFANENPDILLPANLEFTYGNENLTPDLILKEEGRTPPKESWTEVVRKGKSRSKTIKCDNNDRGILEY